MKKQKYKRYQNREILIVQAHALRYSLADAWSKELNNKRAARISIILNAATDRALRREKLIA